jgi:hypothetical protein
MNIRTPASASRSDSVKAARNPAKVSAAERQDQVVRDALNGPGRTIDGAVRENMETRFGHSFADVRIHVDERAAASARALDAAAFTSNKSIVFGAGRYAPTNRDGALLLAHELAHVVHGAHATQRRSGMAPETASAERHADRAAAAALDDSRTGEVSSGLHQWGPAWSIHRQPADHIKKKGTVQHTGEVGRKPGEIGAPTGAVEVRTGEEIELVGGATISNRIALAYTGQFAPDTHWLQFVWFELTAATPAGTAHVQGNVPTSSGNKPFTTDPAAPNWSIDTASSSSPFYEAGFRNLRDNSSLTMFDAPGGGSVSPLADAVFKSVAGTTSVIFSAHFETFLIQANAAVYRVTYQASTAFTQDAAGKTLVGAIGYTIGTSGQISALPADHKTMLNANFPAFKAVK